MNNTNNIDGRTFPGQVAPHTGESKGVHHPKKEKNHESTSAHNPHNYKSDVPQQYVDQRQHKYHENHQPGGKGVTSLASEMVKGNVSPKDLDKERRRDQAGWP